MSSDRLSIRTGVVGGWCLMLLWMTHKISAHVTMVQTLLLLLLRWILRMKRVLLMMWLAVSAVWIVHHLQRNIH